MERTKKPKKPATAKLWLEVAYDPRRTDPESLAGALDRLIETALSIPGVMDDYGETRLGPFRVSGIVGEQEIVLADGAITIDLTGDGGGDIRSSLPRETCDRCGAQECVCDRRELPQDEADRGAYNAAIDGIESLLLALAVEGVITGENTDRADNAIRTAMDALANP